jgi:7-carboxy-7-deazaguanine synthase
MPTVDQSTTAISERLRITEIFYSLQGEARSVGRPTAFVRLTGCPLRCGYCDTPYAFAGGRWMTLADILDEVAGMHPRFVTVTGGEPLAQTPCLRLLSSLCDAGYDVSLETSGAMDVADVDPRVSMVLDVKTPGSGEESKNRYENLTRLAAKDQVKFVICDRADYEWAREKIGTLLRDIPCEVLFSPEHEGMNATELADWILADRLPVRMQIQLHKYLWGNDRGR